MTIRTNILKCIEAGGTPDDIARRICGMLSCECSLDNGNGWYDDDEEMADGGLGQAEGEWLSASEPEKQARIDKYLADMAQKHGNGGV